MKEILKEFKSIIKTVFTKDNLVKFMVLGFLALSLILLFIGFFLVPSNASATTTVSPEYEDGYQDGYENGYEDGRIDGSNSAIDNVVNGLEFFNAVSLYYKSGYLFESTDGGETFQNVTGSQNYSVVNNYTSIRLERTANWNSNAVYYLEVTFTQPININTVRLPSDNRPNPQYVRIGDVNTPFTYNGNINGSAYLVTYDMISSLTYNLRFYFTINGTTQSGSRSFLVYIDGFVLPAQAYDNGYSDGQKSMQSLIDNKDANINVLKEQIETLQTQLNNGYNSWQSLFFAMADTPFKTASNFLGFEIFGVNLFNALIGFITILAIFWVFKRLIK